MVVAPNRRGDIARLGIKAVIAGSLANLLSATIAGFFYWLKWCRFSLSFKSAVKIAAL